MTDKKVKAFQPVRFRSKSGKVTTGIVVQWDDGSKQKYKSMDEVPEFVRLQISELNAKTGDASKTILFASSNASSYDTKGGGILGTKWQLKDDQFSIGWPSLIFAPQVGILGLILVVAFAAGAYFEPAKKSYLWPWIIGGLPVCLLSLASVFLLREKIIIDRKSVRRTRWPAILKRPLEAAPLDSVINAIVQLDVVYGRNTRRVGSVKLRLKKPEGIVWWRVGTDLTWSEAENVGRCLSQFVEVRVDRNDE